MAINLNKLQKGQTIVLEKTRYDLSKVTIGLGWKVREKPKQSFFARLFGGGSNSEEYDLDAIAFLLDENDQCVNLGNRLHNSDVVFFNNQRHPSGAVWSCGDNLVGGDGVSDDEQIVCLLNHVPSNYAKILFLVSIYQGQTRKQCFGDVQGAYIRAVDARGKEIARYELADEPGSADAQSVIFAELYRRANNWKFRAIGTPRRTVSFVDILKDYVKR